MNLVEKNITKQLERVVSSYKRACRGYVGSENTSRARAEVKNFTIQAVREISRLTGLEIPKVYLIQRQLSRGFIIVLSVSPYSVEQWNSLGFPTLPQTDKICSRCKAPLVGPGVCLNCWPPKITEEVMTMVEKEDEENGKGRV